MELPIHINDKEENPMVQNRALFVIGILMLMPALVFSQGYM